eukprot:g4887.t1
MQTKKRTEEKEEELRCAERGGELEERFAIKWIEQVLGECLPGTSLTDALSSGIRLLKLLEVALQLPPLRPPRSRVAIRKNQVLNIKRYVKECEILGIEPSLDPEIALEDQLDVVLHNISHLYHIATSRSKKLELDDFVHWKAFLDPGKTKVIDRDVLASAAWCGIPLTFRKDVWLAAADVASLRQEHVEAREEEPLRRMLIELSSTKCYCDSDRLENVLTFLSRKNEKKYCANQGVLLRILQEDACVRMILEALQRHGETQEFEFEIVSFRWELALVSAFGIVGSLYARLLDAVLILGWDALVAIVLAIARCCVAPYIGACNGVEAVMAIIQASGEKASKMVDCIMRAASTQELKRILRAKQEEAAPLEGDFIFVPAAATGRSSADTWQMI